jgi:hypothetical protein
MADQKSWFEQIAAKIPGYGGYLEKERRRDTDKRHREHLADELKYLKAPLNNVVGELADRGRLFETRPIERITSKLDKLENRIRFASYGYSGLFDLVKIEEPQLDQLYRFDLDLTESIELVKTRVAVLAQANDDISLKAAAVAIEKALDDLDSRFSERLKAIEKL